LARNGTVIAAARWQANCCVNRRQILVALKRNDEYALIIKVMRAVTDSQFNLNATRRLQ